MNDKQDVNININAPEQSKRAFVPAWLRWMGIWLIVLAALSLARQCA